MLKIRKSKNDSSRRSDKKNLRSSAFSYRSNRSESSANLGRNLSQDNNKKTSNRVFWKHLPSYLAVTVLLLLLIYIFSLSTKPKIEVVGQVSPDLLKSNTVYEKAASAILDQSIFNHSKLTINTNSVANKLQGEFPEIDNVSVVIPLVNSSPIIEIQPSQPILVLNNSQGNYIVDQRGRAIIKIGDEEVKSLGLPVIIDHSGLEVKQHEQVVTSDMANFIYVVTSQLKLKNYSIGSLTLPNIPYELDVQLKGQTYIIKFNLLGDASYEVGTYLATVKQLGSAQPSQYIDLRVDGRAYYQ